MNKHYLIVGRQFSAVKKTILESGDKYTLLRDINGSSFKSTGTRRVMCDFSDKGKTLDTVRSLNTKFNGVITTYESYVRPTSWIAEYLNLPALPEEVAIACTDKELMRKLFAKAPEKISPDFQAVNSFDEVKVFAENHTFPLILKPANLAKSLLVTKSNSLDELRSNYEKTSQQIDAVYKKYAPHVNPKLVLEEYLDGSIHSVDAFVMSDGTPLVLEEVVDYQTGYDIGYDDNFHYSRVLPSSLSNEDQQAIRKAAEVGIRALGMKNSPAHVEVILTKNGPRIVEIGARNGGYRERMHKLANGINITQAALDTVVGITPDIYATRNDHCAVLELFPKTPGVFKGIENEDKLKQLDSLQYLSVKAKPEQFVGRSSDGFKMCAVVILSNKNQHQFNEDLKYIQNHCQVLCVQ